MSYGLQPSQNEEWKKKHMIRFVIEERIIEIQDLTLYFFIQLSKGFDLIVKKHDEIDNYIMANKEDTIKVVLALLLILFTMV